MCENEKKKTSSTDYTKVAKALGEIIDDGIKVSLIDINKSDYLTNVIVLE